MPTPNPADNLGVMQKRGDHKIVVLSLIFIAGFQILVPLLFPVYNSYQSIPFDIINAALFIFWVYVAVKCWTMTFEEYNGWVAYGPFLVAAAMFLFFMCWGSVHASAVLNGFSK